MRFRSVSRWDSLALVLALLAGVGVVARAERCLVPDCADADPANDALMWDPVSVVDLTAYRILRDGATCAELPADAVSFDVAQSSLCSGGRELVRLSVVGVDAAGIQGAPSDLATFQPWACLRATAAGCSSDCERTSMPGGCEAPCYPGAPLRLQGIVSRCP